MDTFQFGIFMDYEVLGFDPTITDLPAVPYDVEVCCMDSSVCLLHIAAVSELNALNAAKRLMEKQPHPAGYEYSVKEVDLYGDADLDQIC